MPLCFPADKHRVEDSKISIAMSGLPIAVALSDPCKIEISLILLVFFEYSGIYIWYNLFC